MQVPNYFACRNSYSVHLRTGISTLKDSVRVSLACSVTRRAEQLTEASKVVTLPIKVENGRAEIKPFRETLSMRLQIQCYPNPSSLIHLAPCGN